jgi:hypothetical protein
MRPGRGIARRASPWAGVLALAASLLGACVGRAAVPPTPTSSLTPDTIGVAVSGRDLGSPCETRFTLANGETVTYQNGSYTVCGAYTTTPTLISGSVSAAADVSRDTTASGEPVVYAWKPGEGPLLLSGIDGTTRWIGVVNLDVDGCYRIRLNDGWPDSGAWLEGQQLHLTSGVLLGLALGFTAPTYPEDAFPLRPGDSVCLDSDGQVTSVSVFLPY